MKLLVIGSRVPFPLHDGGAIATFNFLKGLANNGCKVHYITLNTKKHFITDIEAKNEMPFLSSYQSFYIDTDIKPIAAFINLFSNKSYNIERFYKPEFENILNKLVSNENYDIIHFEGLFVTQYAKALKHYTKTPFILRQHNIEFQIWERLAQNENNWFKKKYITLLAQRIKNFEIKISKLFNGIIALAKPDEDVMNNWNLDIPITTISIGFEFKNTTNTQINKNFIYHIGSMEWMPNIDAMEWFANEIWPKVILKNPNVVFYMAGKKMPDSFNQFATKNFIIAGEIDNLENFIADKSMMVVPLKSGSGLRIKTIEALLQGKAVISTTIGAQGLPLQHLKHCIIANTESEIADAIILLIKNEKLRNELAENGKNLIEQNYTIQAVSKKLIEFYQKLLPQIKD